MIIGEIVNLADYHSTHLLATHHTAQLRRGYGMPDHSTAFEYRRIHNVLLIDKNKIQNLILIDVAVQHHDKHLTGLQAFVNLDTHI